jgi:DNA-binding NtrC family response regulator
VGGSEPKRASDEEVLIVDGDKNILKGLERLLTEAGMAVSTLSDPTRARDQLEKRFIPVVLCDLDTPEPGAGVDLLKFVHEKSPLTAFIVMTARKSFEAVAPAFRAGATDVVPKTQDQVPYLRDRVVQAALDVRATHTRDQLLTDVAEVHEDFLRRMMDMNRQITDLEDKLLAREGGTSGSSPDLSVMHVLLVDDEPALSAVLERDLPADKGWRFRYAQSGGEALDAATQTSPHVLVVKETLPDLPGTMVVKTIKGSIPDVVALLFTPPSEGITGTVKMIDQSRLFTLVPSFSEPEQLAGALQEVRDALKKKAKERRYLQVFRNQQMEFLKQYHALKQRLETKR